LKLHETTKEKLGDSKEILGKNKKSLGKKRKSLEAPAISIPRGRRLTKDV
jgi:hypothetical protein